MAAVAELMNAKDHPDVVRLANDAQGTGNTVPVSGAWRIWNEHGGDNEFRQGRRVAAATTSNPDHVFEVHPITSFAGVLTHPSFKPVPGHTPKLPENAFRMYEQVRATIIPGNGKTTNVSGGIGYNYVRFQMVLNERPFPISDGSVAMAKIQDLEGHLILRNKRMVFVKSRIRHLKSQCVSSAEGACVQVLGIPRLNLALVSWRVAHRNDVRKPLTWNLPYEMIVVGVYGEPCDGAGSCDNGRSDRYWNFAPRQPRNRKLALQVAT